MIPPPPRSTLFPYTSSSDLSSSRLRQNAMRRTMRIPLYQVDAFAGRVFAGNPAAVCPLERWLDDATLQDRKSTRLNSSHITISYAVFCLKKKTQQTHSSKQR